MNYAQWFGTDFVAVRFPAVFGPWKGRGGGGPTNLFRELIEKSVRGEEVTFPAGRIEYVYSKDAAQGAVRACHAEHLKHRVFNIGMGAVYGADEIAALVRTVIPNARVTGVERRTEAASPPPVVGAPMDLTRSRSELGFQPQFDMESAIRDYGDFCRSRA